MPSTHTYNNCGCCGGVPTDCCPDDDLPTSLFATLDGTNCPLFDGAVIELVWDEGSSHWRGSVGAPPDEFIVLTLSCLAGPAWNLHVNCSDTSTGNESPEAGGSCLPFSQTFIWSVAGPCCDFFNTFTVTITE